MKKSLLVLHFLAVWLISQAQNQSQFMALNDSAYQTTAEYQSGNIYQKDAILFMDMVADTHPYYVKAERRAEWFAKKPALLERCKSIQTDEAFADALIEVLGPLRDNHTDIATMKRMRGSRQTAATSNQDSEPGAIDTAHIMRPHASYYDYQIFYDKSICYLQFNKCFEASDYPFAMFLNDMFAKMKEGNIKTLVVDMQYNGGGNSQLCDQLLQHLYPIDQLKVFTDNLRFSNLMVAHYPQFAEAKKNWEDDGHKDELYQMPEPNIPTDYQQPEIYKGQVVFVMGKRTYSSAGMLMTLARDNHIGTIIGTTSSFPPSHYGEILLYSLPNTGVLGSISCKFFARPDAATANDTFLQPDYELNLDDKDLSWQYILEKYGK